MSPLRRAGAAIALAAAVAAATVTASTATASKAATTTVPGHPAAQSALPADYRAFIASVGGSHYVTVHGVRMHFVASGPKTAPTLLLLHGSPDNIYAWRAIMPRLARHYRVIAPDLVGFGLSGHPSGPLTWSGEVTDLTGFIRAEHLTHLTLVMTDIGALFGAAYAAAHPGNVTAIALWESVTAPIPSYQLLGGYCAQCVQFFKVPKDPALAKQYIIDNPGFAREIYGGPGLVHPLSGAALAGYSYFLRTREQRQLVVDIGRSMPIAGDPAVNERIAETFARYLRTSGVPKLLLYATPGSILPAATAIGLGMPHTTYMAVGKGYHYLAEDEPAAITSDILSWRAHLPN